MTSNFNTCVMDRADRVDVLKSELELIQETFNKYDDLLYRNRNWFISLWVAVIGAAVTLNSSDLAMIAALLSVLYFFLEGILRFQYMYKYVDRYRHLRAMVNQGDFDISDINIYDLTNKLNRDELSWKDKCRYNCKRLIESFFRLSSIIFYISMGLLTYLVVRHLESGI